VVWIHHFEGGFTGKLDRDFRPSCLAENLGYSVAVRVGANRFTAFLALAFLLKLLVLLQLKGHPLTQPDAGLDTTAYVELARRVLAGDWALGPGLYYVSPFYIYVLALSLAAFRSYTAVRVLQIVLGTAAIGLLMASTRRWFGVRAAWISGGFAALTGLLTFYEVLILQAAIDPFLTSLGLYCLTVGLTAADGAPARDLRAESALAGRGRKSSGGSRPGPTVGSAEVERNRAFAFLCAGAVFGLQTLNRPNTLIAAAGLSVLLAAYLRRVRPAAWVAVGLIAGMAPVAVRNLAVAHEFSFVSSHGGLNFYIGNAPDATGFYRPVNGIRPMIAGQETDVRRVAEKALGHTVTDAEASDYFYGLSRDWTTAHPGAALLLFVKKLYFVFNRQHIALPHSYPFYVKDDPTALRFFVVGPWLLFPLGLVGLVAAAPRDRRREYVVWASFVPLYAVAVAIFFVAERYRLPLLVPLCASAGALVDRALVSWQASRLRSFALPAAALAAAAVAFNWPLHLNDSRWEEGLRLAQRLVILGRADDADRWTEKMAAREPHPGATAEGVAEQYLLLGTNDRAVALLQRAHAANPADARLDYDLGRALFRSGRAQEALPHLERGFDAGIELPNGGFDYAAALHAVGQDAAAASAVRRIRPADEEPSDAWLRLGRLAAEAHAPDAAEPFFRHAVEMDPGSASGQQQLGLNLLVLNRWEDAAAVLARAAQLDPHDPDTLSHLAYCEAKLGQTEDARSHATAALAINPRDPLATEIYRIIARAR
jgi:tetratricopeptide (TPR) repeat protein